MYARKQFKLILLTELHFFDDLWIMEPWIIGFAFIALVLGVLIGWLWKGRTDWISPAELQADYSPKKRVVELENALAEAQETATQSKIREQHIGARLQSIQSAAADERKRSEQLLADAKAQFSEIASTLLHQTADRTSSQQEKRLSEILSPLKDELGAFKQKVEARQEQSTAQHIGLNHRLDQLMTLNTQLSVQAESLTQALRGNSKVQGDWGEWQLKVLLDASGLKENLHYELQNSYRNDQQLIQRPDCIINMPSNQHLILDSKVSLTDYARHIEQKDANEQAASLKQHIKSIRKHMNELADKQYARIKQLNTPQYVIMFVPIEQALTLALEHDKSLLTEGMRRGVLILNAPTLLMSLSTIHLLWQQSQLNERTQAVIKEASLLYDKMVLFVEDMESVDQQLAKAHASHQAAFSKLSKSSKKGTTVLGRIERMKELLPLQTKKSLTQ